LYDREGSYIEQHRGKGIGKREAQTADNIRLQQGHLLASMLGKEQMESEIKSNGEAIHWEQDCRKQIGTFDGVYAREGAHNCPQQQPHHNGERHATAPRP
jgi:hypothetical protein